MPAKRTYSNATFTKRVDHLAGKHRPPRAESEPSICVVCGAVYAKRRWAAPSRNLETHQKRPLRQTVCPACTQEASGEPRGFLFLDGGFYVSHQADIERLLRNEGLRSLSDNPLARIMGMKKGGGHKLCVTTTTEHLAQRLGHALEKAYGGKVEYDFSHENKLARVYWQRE